ncbi:MAG: hypothetical protein ACJATT_000934 [Myxococcota bacterium]
MRTILLLSALLLCACVPENLAPDLSAADLGTNDVPVHDLGIGKDTLGPVRDVYRSIGLTAVGPITSGLASSTQVWPVSRSWDATDSGAGLAWDTNSGLSWDEKFATWVDSLTEVTGEDGHATVQVTTPWGRTLPSPRLECAEMAMFLRVSFAAWYELPFFMSAYSPSVGHTVFYGHFGLVNGSGARLSGTPRFATSYNDYTDDFAHMSGSALDAAWPDDTSLETRAITSSRDDVVEFLGADAYAGAYFDELHLNKRVGWFLLRLLPNFGSINIADAHNLFNLEPSALREGDVLLHRWQAQGIGHVMVVKEVEQLAGGNLDAEIIFGSMPRIQPRWYSARFSKGYFTSPYSGSASTASDGTPYSQFGGGIKRWRTAEISDGRWRNTVPEADIDDWIGSTDWPAIEARPAEFEAMLGDLTPREQRDVYLDRIETARTNLERRPASCANRQRRERAFDDLYVLMDSEWDWSRERVDSHYRDTADYVYAELDYANSKTCCWNSTTPAMADIIAQYTDEQVAQAYDNDQCTEPVVFKARDGGGYAPFATYAVQIGRADEWVEWSEDESCAARGVDEDIETNAPWTNFCDLEDVLVGGEDPDPIDAGTSGSPGSTGSPNCSGCSGRPAQIPWLPLIFGSVLFGARRRR